MSKAKLAEENTSGFVEIKIPRSGPKTEQQVMIGINGKNWIIPKGKTVKVPDFVAAEYYRAEEARDRMYERQEELNTEEMMSAVL